MAHWYIEEGAKVSMGYHKTAKREIDEWAEQVRSRIEEENSSGNPDADALYAVLVSTLTKYHKKTLVTPANQEIAVQSLHSYIMALYE